MTSDDRTLIVSLIFGGFLIFAGMLFRYIKYGIPFWKSLLELWQEMLKGFKEFRKNFIPVTKKIIGEIRGYIKENRDSIWESIKEILSSIVKFIYPDSEPVKHTFGPELEYGLLAVLSGYAYSLLPIDILFFCSAIPSYIYVSLYTKGAITANDEAAIVWAVTAKFKGYMRVYGLNFQYFAVSYVQGNHIEVYIYYCEYPAEYPAYTNKRNQIMQMRSAPAFKPLTEADLPKTSDIVLGYSYEKWTTTGKVDPIPWDVAKAPHAMVSGSTGGGKSVYVKLLLTQLLEAGASVCACDYKGQNDYRGLLKDIATGADCGDRLTRFCADFEKVREQGGDGKWRVLIFDEFGSFVAAKEKKEREELMKAISNVVFMGRSYKYSIVLVSQRFDADTIKTSLREQFGVKVHMGETISKEAATMLFPNSDVDKSERLPLCCGRICTPKTDYDIITVPKVDIPALDRRIKELGDNAP